MDARILDQRKENNSKCFLVKITLQEYVKNLPGDFKDYEIQREIVANAYLDNLVDTVLKKNHIPPIVLIIEEPTEVNGLLKIESFKILDGLQRTYRLNAIWKTLLLFDREVKANSEILSLTKYSLSRHYSKELATIDSSTRILQSIITYYINNRYLDGFNLFDPFENNFQWFEVWSGLTPDEEVSKMLVLNAGHKPVKIKHQLELIFRGLIPLLDKIGFKNLTIKREKEISSIQFGKTRIEGSFHFSHLIAALLSIKEGTPVTTNSSYIQKIQNSDFDSENDSKYFTFTFLTAFIQSMLDIDSIVSKEFKGDGVRWMGREVTLVGIYGALGDYATTKAIPHEQAFSELKKIVIRSPRNLNIIEFEGERNNLELSKVNIGNANKNAIFRAFKFILEHQELNSIDWSHYFNTSEL